MGLGLRALPALGRAGRVGRMLATLVEFGLPTTGSTSPKFSIVRGHSQAAGAKGGPARKALLEAAAALRAKSTPVVAVRVAHLASS